MQIRYAHVNVLPAWETLPASLSSSNTKGMRASHQHQRHHEVQKEGGKMPEKSGFVEESAHVMA
jgi:hypothetical protein